MMTARFAKTFVEGKELAIFVTGGNKDVMDEGYMQGSYEVPMSDKQYAKLMKMVNQENDGSEIPFQIRPYGKGVRIYEY